MIACVMCSQFGNCVKNVKCMIGYVIYIKLYDQYVIRIMYAEHVHCIYIMLLFSIGHIVTSAKI